MVEIQRLEQELARAVRGEARFDKGARAAYSADASNYRQVPLGVVLPRSIEDVVAAMALARTHGVPVLARGGGTSQCGQGVNEALVIDCSKYLNRVLEIDAAARLARVEPGTVCDTLRDAAERHGLTFAPDPATHSRCTLGGMIANNSCGPHSVMAGKTVENIERLEVLTYDGARFRVGPNAIPGEGRQGEIYKGLKALIDRYGDLVRGRFPKIKRRVSGYNLDQLLPENGFNVARALVGSEGTCAFTLQAEARLVKSPPARVLVALGFADIFAAADAVPRLMEAKPIACEGLDENIIGGLRSRGLKLDDIALLPPGNAWVMLEFGADTREAAVAQARTVPGLLVEDPVLMQRLWTIRETGASATALKLGGKGPDPVVGWEDAAVDPLRLGDYLREFRALVARFGYSTSIYGHFGDGCIHARIDFELRTPEGLARWRAFLVEAAHLVVKYGGSLSGEHGDGQAKGELLPVMYGPELMQAMREFKRIWDPQNRMNPGKLIDAYPFDTNLKFGPDYRPVELKTTMQFKSDIGDGFLRATERCIGMGKCRSEKGGTMCPSYRGTREERYSTRGRARLLSEMLRGEVITEGWQSEDVREALEWCLACKGCSSDCPTHTDMAAYKAEFLSHYHEHHARPRQALMGLIGEWAPYAAAFPSLTNFFSGIAKPMLGIASQRKIPKFASRTFRSQFRRGAKGDRVVLFDDTFNNHFRPQTALAAQKVLERAGYAPQLPEKRVCCGRPYYDFGMLDRAKRSLVNVLDVLAPQLDAGLPIVVLEPGCLSVFKDEIRRMLPDDPRGERLSRQSLSLAQALGGRSLPPMKEKILMHGHCHQKALWGTKTDIEVLRGAGCEVSAPETGCCGMGGSFGYRPEFYETSKHIAGLEVLPAIAAAPGAAIVADGFSCREQIEALSGRPTLHLAEVLAR